MLYIEMVNYSRRVINYKLKKLIYDFVSMIENANDINCTPSNGKRIYTVSQQLGVQGVHCTQASNSIEVYIIWILDNIDNL